MLSPQEIEFSELYGAAANTLEKAANVAEKTGVALASDGNRNYYDRGRTWRKLYRVERRQSTRPREAGELLRSIKTDTVVGLRDRADRRQGLRFRSDLGRLRHICCRHLPPAAPAVAAAAREGRQFSTRTCHHTLREPLLRNILQFRWFTYGAGQVARRALRGHLIQTWLREPKVMKRGGAQPDGVFIASCLCAIAIDSTVVAVTTQRWFGRDIFTVAVVPCLLSQRFCFSHPS